MFLDDLLEKKTIAGTLPIPVTCSVIPACPRLFKEVDLAHAGTVVVIGELMVVRLASETTELCGTIFSTLVSTYHSIMVAARSFFP